MVITQVCTAQRQFSISFPRWQYSFFPALCAEAASAFPASTADTWDSSDGTAN